MGYVFKLRATSCEMSIDVFGRVKLVVGIEHIFERGNRSASSNYL